MASAGSSSSSSKRKREIKENALDGMAPAPPSPPSTSKDQSFPCYDVYISRGPDVQNTFASVLHQFLQYLGYKVFQDSTEFFPVYCLPAATEHAIYNSRVHIVIFSEEYGNSPRRLIELHLMLGREAQIFPVFYGVKPHEVRHLDKGPYSAAFTEYRKNGIQTDKLEQWKQALWKASFITGTEFDPSNGILGNLCTTIVDAVLNKVREVRNEFKLEVPEHLVGLEDTIQELEAKISTIGQVKTGHGNIVGIVGEAGVGKTILAKEFYNRRHPTFCRSSFLLDVGEAHRNNTLGKMQRKLIDDLSIPLPFASANFRPSEGFAVDIKSHLNRWYSKPLIILDGVDRSYQLEAFALNEFLNFGALVIVTCREDSVFQSFEMVKTYQMRGLDPKYARQLFCWHAFRQSHPPSGREKLVESFVSASAGLPSHLKTVGEEIFLYAKSIDAVKL